MGWGLGGSDARPVAGGPFPNSIQMAGFPPARMKWVFCRHTFCAGLALSPQPSPLARPHQWSLEPNTQPRPGLGRQGSPCSVPRSGGVRK